MRPFPFSLLSDHSMTSTMTERVVDLIKKVCPFVVMAILRETGKMQKGDTTTFIVNDPLAIKSIPEELDDYYDDLTYTIHKVDEGWRIKISRL